MQQFSVIFPESPKFWRFEGRNQNGRFIWIHKDNPRLKISSEIENIFGQNLWIYPAIAKNKPTFHPYGVNLRLGKIDTKNTYIPIDLNISIETGYIAVISDPSYFSAVFPLEKGKSLIISFVPK